MKWICSCKVMRLHYSKSSPPSRHSSQNYSSTEGTLDAANSISFPVCLTRKKKTGVKDDDIAVYCAHLAELHRDMSVRFNDQFSLETPGWVIDPFTEPSTEVPTYLEEELVNLQNDEDWKINVNHFCLLKLFFILFKLFVIEESTNSYDI